jgi:hypothetical protein
VAEKMANNRNGSQTVVIKVCSSFNFAVIFDFQLFSVPPSKAESIGDVLTNRQNATTWYIVFFLFYNLHCKIDAPNHPALLGNAGGRGKKRHHLMGQGTLLHP